MALCNHDFGSEFCTNLTFGIRKKKLFWRLKCKKKIFHVKKCNLGL